VAVLNVSAIPQTPEKVIMGVGIVFGIGFICLILWTLYQAYVNK